MWKNDRAEVAEMESRLAMMKKKEEYAAAVASAAASAAESPAVIFKSRKSVTSAMAAPLPAAASAGVSSSGRSSRSSGSQLNRVLSLSPPSPRESYSVPGAPSAERKERHTRKGSTMALAPVHLEHGEDTEADRIVVSQPMSIPESSCLQSLEPEVDGDVEGGSGAAAGGAAVAVGDLPHNNYDQAAIESDDLPPPHGWEVRTTPSGEK